MEIGDVYRMELRYHGQVVGYSILVLAARRGPNEFHVLRVDEEGNLINGGYPVGAQVFYPASQILRNYVAYPDAPWLVRASVAL